MGHKSVIFARLFTLFLFLISAVNLTEDNDWAYHNAVMATNKSLTLCDFEGRTYSEGQRIAVKNACIYCFCGKGRAKCFRQNCPPPPMGCELLDSADSCKSASIYNCSIPERHEGPVLRRDAKLYGQRERGRGLVEGDCLIRGIAYQVGETVGVASSPCLQCLCARRTLLCMPLCCYESILAIARDRNAVARLFHRTLRQRDPHPLEHL